MSETIQYLREINLDNGEYLINYIENSSIEELIILAEYLRGLVKKDYIKETYNPFTFVPGDDLSGAGGCDEISCKVKRATRFAIFSAMYANDVYIQLNFITAQHSVFNIKEIQASRESNVRFRERLLCDITILNTYSKLIEARIVHIEPPKKSYCKDCFQKAVLGLNNPIDIEPIKESVMNRVELKVRGYNEKLNSVFFQINNIDEFFPEHGHIYEITKNEMTSFPELPKEKGAIITDRNFIGYFMSRFLNNEFISSCYYALYCKTNNAKFITNKTSDGMFMGLANQKHKSNYGLDYYTAIPKYDMPFVSDITIEKALHLREIEGESFNKYRIALNKAITEQCKTNSSVEWNDIYDDILFPAFSQLDEKLKNIRKGIFKKTFSEIALVGTVISSGIYTGIIPNNVTDIMKSIGIGTGTSVTVAHQIFGKVPGKESLKENDYYFLWQLKRDIDKKIKR